MGNEQSSSSGGPGGPSSSTSTFSFLANRASVKKSKGIVVVSDGQVKQSTIEEDDLYKRLQEIPRFLPILRNAVGKKESQTDSHHRMSSRPIFKFATRLQEHLSICGRTITTDQAQLSALMKKIDSNSSVVVSSLTDKKRSYDRFVAELQLLPRLNDDVMKIQLLLEELVPVAETLNELLVPSERLPPLDLRRVLERSAPSSTQSSLMSTPRRVPGQLEVIEEIRVVDRD